MVVKNVNKDGFCKVLNVLRNAHGLTMAIKTHVLVKNVAEIVDNVQVQVHAVNVLMDID